MLANAGKPIPLDRIVNGNADTQTMRPYVQLIWTGGTRRGPAPERRTIGAPGFEEKWERTSGTATCSITVVGVVDRDSYDDDADAYTVELAARLTNHDLSQPIRDANLAVAGDTELPSLDALTGQSQWETRSALDVLFTTAVVVTTQPGIVQTAVIDGTTDPPTPIENPIEVSAP